MKKNPHCPPTSILEQFMLGSISHEERFEVEKHLVRCCHCRDLLIETMDNQSVREAIPRERSVKRKTA